MSNDSKHGLLKFISIIGSKSTPRESTPQNTWITVMKGQDPNKEKNVPNPVQPIPTAIPPLQAQNEKEE